MVLNDFDATELSYRSVARVGRCAIAIGESGAWYVSIPARTEPAWEGISGVFYRARGVLGQLDGVWCWRINPATVPFLTSEITQVLAVDPDARCQRGDSVITALRYATTPRTKAPNEWLSGSPGTAAAMAEVLPAGLELKPYQLGGIDFLIARQGSAILADVQGLGKTPQAIGYLMLTGRFPALVIAPASVTGKWVDEIHQWGARVGIQPHLVTADDQGQLRPADVYVVSHDSHALRPSLTQARFRQIIVDEAHYDKNEDTNRASALIRLRSLNPEAGILFMSGTPILNHANEMFPLLAMIDPKLVGLPHLKDAKMISAESERFHKRHSLLGTRRFKVVYKRRTGATPSANEARTPPAARYVPLLGVMDSRLLHERLFGQTDSCPQIMLRRTKDVIPDLPPKSVLFRSVPVPEASRERLDRLTQEFLQAQDGDTVEEAFTGLRRLIGMAKVPQVLTLLGEQVAAGSPTVVFVHHYEVRDALRSHMVGKGVPHLLLDGTMSENARRRTCKEFATGKYPVILCTQAAREGINLVAATGTIMAEREVVPGWEMQAEDRTHRIPQTKPCTIHYLVLESPIDLILSKIIERKKKDVQAVMDGTPPWSSPSDSVLRQMQIEVRARQNQELQRAS
jgi:SNF2 family DNA or RNA helicase